MYHLLGALATLPGRLHAADKQNAPNCCCFANQSVATFTIKMHVIHHRNRPYIGIIV